MKVSRRGLISFGALSVMVAGMARVARMQAASDILPGVETGRAGTIRHAERRVRSMIGLEAPPGDDWVAVWCYLPRVQLRTVYSWQHNEAIAGRVEKLSQQQQGGGDEWAAINGGYFDWNRHLQTRRAIIGSVGNGRDGRWSHGSPPSSGGRRFQRWAWGVRQSNGETQFQSALMERREGIAGFWVPRRMEKAAPYGLSGLLCLLQNGQAQAWQEPNGETRAAPLGQWNGRTEFLEGEHRWAAIAWSADGKHLFLLIHRSPTTIVGIRDLFARYQGQRYVGAGAVLTQLRRAFERLPPQERPCTAGELPTRIASAFILDSGKCATMMYRRMEAGRARDFGSWETGPAWRPSRTAVPTTIEVSER